MGRASRAKQERRAEEQELPEQAKSTGDVVAQAQTATAKGGDR
jgi:hypothetical protein